MSAMISIPSLLSGLDWAILFYFLAVNGFYLVILAFATLEMRRHLLRIREESRWHVLGSEVAPTLSMIAPAHNEGSTVAGGGSGGSRAAP